MNQTVVTSNNSGGGATLPSTIENANSQTTSYVFDSFGRVTSITLPQGGVTSYTYDANGNITQTQQTARTGFSGTITTSAVYGNYCSSPLTLARPSSTTDANGHTTTYTYNCSNGAIATVTSPQPTSGATASVTNFDYFSASLGGTTVWLPLDTWACQTMASCTGSADKAITALCYNTNGMYCTTPMNVNALAQAQWVYSGTGSTNAITAFGYDNYGNVTQVTDPRSNVSNFTWNLLRQKTMDIAPLVSDATTRTAVQYLYNTDGLIATLYKGTTNSTGGSFTALEEADSYYDVGDRLATTAVLSGAGGSPVSLTQYAYYPAGGLQCAAVRMNPSVYGSAPYSSLPSACMPSTIGVYGADVISQAGYDGVGHLTTVQAILSPTVTQTLASLTYTNDGVVQTYEDARSNAMSFAYDGFDRLSTTTYPGGSTEQNQYDPNGNLTIWTNRGGYGVVRCYDALNRKISEAGITGATNAGSCPTGGTANSGFTFGSRTFGYDLVSRMTSANSSTSGWNEAWVYDAWNNLDSFTTPLGTYGQLHDLAGNLTQLTGPDGYVVGYVYDAMNRMIKATYTPPGGTAATVASLTYDSLGRRSGVSYGDTSTATWSWDAADRLTSLAHAFPASASNVTLSYGYDPAFRATSRALSNGAYANGGPFGATSYGTANSLNQYPSVNGQAFSWLAQGPLQTDQTQGYGYDELNHLADSNKIASPATSAYTPADPLGLTYARETSNLATNTLTYYSGNGQSASHAMERVYAYTGGAWTWQGDRPLIQGPGPDEFLGYVDTSGAVYYPHTDETGSAIALSRGTGAPTVFTYDPFGVSASPIQDQPTGALTYAYRYTGQRLDPLTGIYDYKARAYEPSLGRFLQADPAGLSASPNLYAYAGNNPIFMTDPLGLQGNPSNGACDISSPYYDPSASCTLTAGAGPGSVSLDPDGSVTLFGTCNSLCQFNRGTCVTVSCLSGLFATSSSDYGLGVDNGGSFFGPGTGGGASVGSSAGNPQTRDACYSATLLAAGVDIRHQIFVTKAATLNGLPLFTSFIMFAALVNTGGPFDYKNQPGPGTPQQRIDAGNIAYGAACPFGVGFCQFAAGMAQTLAGRPSPIGTLATGFDTPTDNASIRVGQAMRAAGCR